MPCGTVLRCAVWLRVCIPIRLITLNPNSSRYTYTYFRRFSTFHPVTQVVQVTDFPGSIYLGTRKFPFTFPGSRVPFTSFSFFSFQFLVFSLLSPYSRWCSFHSSCCLSLYSSRFFSFFCIFNYSCGYISSFEFFLFFFFPPLALGTHSWADTATVAFVRNLFFSERGNGSQIGTRRKSDQTERDFFNLDCSSVPFSLGYICFFASRLHSFVRIHSFFAFCSRSGFCSLFVDLMKRFIYFEERENNACAPLYV